MNNYELTYLISPEISEEQIQAVSQGIVSYIEEQGGVLSGVQNRPLKKFLGHPIEDNTMAFVGTLLFSLAPEKTKSLEEKLKQEKQILRIMLITKPEKEKLNFRKIRKKFAPSNAKKQKVELKEIDKKIEEILK
jgi:small subunit ribosomal protein S6